MMHERSCTLQFNLNGYESSGCKSFPIVEDTTKTYAVVVSMFWNIYLILHLHLSDTSRVIRNFEDVNFDTWLD